MTQNGKIKRIIGRKPRAPRIPSRSDAIGTSVIRPAVGRTKKPKSPGGFPRRTTIRIRMLQQQKVQKGSRDRRIAAVPLRRTHGQIILRWCFESANIISHIFRGGTVRHAAAPPVQSVVRCLWRIARLKSHHRRKIAVQCYLFFFFLVLVRVCLSVFRQCCVRSVTVSLYRTKLNLLIYDYVWRCCFMGGHKIFGPRLKTGCERFAVRIYPQS